MVGGRVGFYELEKSDFVLFKAHFTLNKAHILQYNCRLCAFRALKKRKLNFFGHMYPKKLNEHLIFQPSLKFDEGELSAQCKRPWHLYSWRRAFCSMQALKKNVPFSLASVYSNLIENSGFWNLIEVVAKFCWVENLKYFIKT